MDQSDCVFSCLDTIQMMQAYCDVIVLRHPEPGAAKVCVCVCMSL